MLIGVVVDDRVARSHERERIGHIHHVRPEVVVALHEHHARRAIHPAVVVDVETGIDHVAEVVGRTVAGEVVFDRPKLGEIEGVAVAGDLA